jgi:uncharacterized protein
MPQTFLTAEWRHLLMLNYEAPRDLLTPYLPAGVELDLYEGRVLVSLVGFRFLHTRILGRLPVPFHINFDELNLRFYVARHMPDGEVRRGVCFIREFVPRAAIAITARVLYDEPYTAVPMRHEMALDAEPAHVAYGIRVSGRWHTIYGQPVGVPALATADPAVGFITEHYWGYTKRRSGKTSEYQVVHPVWQARRVAAGGFDGDAGALYGRQWANIFTAPPHSAFLADGSPVSVLDGEPLRE